jgi:hypothetical protein
MRGRTAAVPTVSIGQPNAQGDLDKAIIRRYIKRNIAKIQYCYEKELLAKSNLSGTVQTQFFITANGNVSQSVGNGVDPNVANCVAAVIQAIEFPKPKGGGGVQVNYPFTFRPAGWSRVESHWASGDLKSTATANQLSPWHSEEYVLPFTYETPRGGALRSRPIDVRHRLSGSVEERFEEVARTGATRRTARSNSTPRSSYTKAIEKWGDNHRVLRHGRRPGGTRRGRRRRTRSPTPRLAPEQPMYQMWWRLALREGRQGCARGSGAREQEARGDQGRSRR